ncbi:MAG: prefoldin subunit alpha [Candidatus Altiarchaeales archaeon WOR_SM1_79]|nr:MAG: prefoldin subunit alpha [Candidatus Altiarchaeales archaeon WOR_SM1_79]
MDPKQQELQRLLVQIENLNREREGIEGQINVIDLGISEAENTINTLNALKETRVGEEILAPLGSNTFIKAKISDNEKSLVGVGADTFIEKNTSDAIEALRARIEELLAKSSEFKKASHDLGNKIMELNKRAEGMVS